MNWTGGRLNRHAKSSSRKPELKAQKQHFARISLNNHTIARSEALHDSTVPPTRHSQELALHRRPAANSLLQGHHLHKAGLNGTFHKLLKRMLCLLRGPEHALTRSAGLHGRPATQETTRVPNDGHVKRTNSKHRSVAALDVPHLEQASTIPNTVNEMRKKLLSRSDWLGLSVCRPPEIHFSSTNEQAKVGRHRKQVDVNERSFVVVPPDTYNYHKTGVLGKRKRVPEPSSTSKSPALGTKFASLPQRSSSRSSRILASTPPQQVELSDSARASRTEENLSLPPIPSFDPDRANYQLIDTSADSENSPADLVPLEVARNMGNFTDVQERYLSSRSGHRDNVGQDVRGKVNSSLIGSEPMVGRQKPGLGYRAFIQQPARERSSALVRTVDQQTPASSQRRRHRGKYQLDLEFADAAHVDASFEKLSEPCVEDKKVAAYRETSPFFPESVVDSTNTRRIAQAGPEDSASIRIPTSLFPNGSETTQHSAEGRFVFPATPSAKLSTHQLDHASETSS